MLIEDISLCGNRPTPHKYALDKALQIHRATKISTIVNNPPQIRPDLRRFSSFDMLPTKPQTVKEPAPLSQVRTQVNQPKSIQAQKFSDIETVQTHRKSVSAPRQPKRIVNKSLERAVLIPPSVTPKRYETVQPAIKQPVWRRLLDFMQYPLVAIAVLLAAYNSTAGQVIIVLYALFAIFIKVNSKYTFGGALLLLIAIPTFQALGESWVSEKCAIYAYELLVVGTLQAIVETWLENRTNKVKRTTSHAKG